MVWCGWLHFVDLPWRQEGSPKTGSKILFQQDKSDAFFNPAGTSPKNTWRCRISAFAHRMCHLFLESCWILKHFFGASNDACFSSTCFSQCFLRGSYSSYVPTKPQRFVLYEDHMSSLAVLEWWKIFIYNLQQKLHSLKLT